jgi:flagellar assembly protein FliH
MSAPAKFMFEADFGAAGARAADPVAKLALAEAEARGFKDGYAAARAETERRMSEALERIGAGVEQLARGLAAVEGRLEAEAIDVAVAVARKLAPALVAREPFAELSALAADCFSHLIGAPHVVVRVNDALYEQARQELETIAHARGFEGRLVVLAEPEIAHGDCRIEWADGGLARDRAKTEAAINEAVDNYIAVRRRGAPSPVHSGALNNE